MLLSILAMIMPTPWMDKIHQFLGLGPFPQTPLVEYLARSASGMYAMQGGLYLVLARDVNKYRQVIFWVAIMNAIFAISVMIIDHRSQLPLYWILIEGPSILVIALVMIFLSKTPIKDKIP